MPDVQFEIGGDVEKFPDVLPQMCEYKVVRTDSKPPTQISNGSSKDSDDLGTP